jgi:MFS family permease
MDVLLDYVSELNWLAVAVATLAAMVIGATWYAPPLFGRFWMKTAGLKEKDLKDGSMRPIVFAVLSSFVTAVALGVLVQVLALTTVLQGALLGALVALGFIGANKVMQSQFEKRRFAYNIVVVSCDTVTLAVMGAILAVWV